MRIPNSFLTEFSSTPNELKAVCFMYSLINPFTAVDENGNFVIKVKQETLAKRCYVSVATVKRTVAKLMDKGFIMSAQRSIKCNGELGTYYYTIKKYPLNREYFTLAKRSLYMLSGKQFVVYCHCVKSSHKDVFFKSYSALASETGFKRSDVIRIIDNLVSDGFLAKYKRRTKAGDNTANVYLILYPTMTMVYFFKALKDKLSSSKQSETKKSLELWQQSKAQSNKIKNRFSKFIVTHINSFVKRFLKKVLGKVKFLI